MPPGGVLSSGSQTHGHTLGGLRRLSLVLSDFELLRTLGEGSVSHVVLARHRATGREYAIKIVDKHFVLRNKLAASIKLERKLLDALDDPGIVRLEFTFQDEASLYLGLQCCPHGALAWPVHARAGPGGALLSQTHRAGELFDQIARRGKLPPADARFYAAEVVLMLRYLRSRQVRQGPALPAPLLRPVASSAPRPPRRWCTGTSSRRTCCLTGSATSS